MTIRTLTFITRGTVAVALLLGAASAQAQEFQEDFNTATGTPGATILDGSGIEGVDDFDDGLTGENGFAGTVGTAQATATAQGTTNGGVGSTGAAQISFPTITFNLLSQDFGNATGLGGGAFVATGTPDTEGFTPSYDTGISGSGAFGGTFNGAVVNGSISAQGLTTGGVGGTGGGQLDVTGISSADWFAGLQFDMAAFPGASSLVNPSFDAGGAATLDGWEVFSAGFNVNPGTCGGGLEPTECNSGAGALKLFGQFNADGNESGVFQALPAQEGQTWEIDAWSQHVGGDDLTFTSNEVVMKIEFFDDMGTMLLADEAVILDSSSPVDVWIDNAPLSLTAPAGTVEVRPVIDFIQNISTEDGAGWVDDVSFKITAGTNPVNIADFELTASVKGTGATLGDYQLRIEDTDGNRLIFSETANGAFQTVGGFLNTATEADAAGVPMSGVFNPNSDGFTVVVAFENGTWGTGGTLEVDNVFVPSDDPGSGAWFGGLFWDNLPVTQSSANDLALTADILGSVVDGALQLRLECFKSVLSGVEEGFTTAQADGGVLMSAPFLSAEAVAGGQNFGETLAWDSGISGANAYGGVFGAGTSTAGFFARGVNTGGNPGKYAYVRAEEIVFGPGGGWFGGMSWGGQGLASTDLSQVTISADVKGATVSGGGLGEVELRLEDEQGDRLYFCAVATTGWQTITGTLDDATFGDSFTGGNGQFDLDSPNYTLVVAFSNETADQLGCDEVNSNPWGFGGELQIDNVFITPAASDREIGRVTFKDTATGAFESVGGNLSAADENNFGDYDEDFSTATGTFDGVPGGVTWDGGNILGWDDGLERENGFFGVFGDGAVGDGATAQACLTCGAGGGKAGQIIVPNSDPGTGGWFAGMYFAGLAVDLSAGINGGQAALTDVFLTADIKGVAAMGETPGTYFLRIEDGDLTTLTFELTANGNFQPAGGPLSDATLVDIDQSNGMFNYGQGVYNVSIGAEADAALWGPSMELTVDNLFLTGVSLGNADTCTVAVAFDDEINSWFDEGEITIDNINLTEADNSCVTIADCGDANDDGFRDDPCLHYSCIEGACVVSERGVGQTDMGGQFGACANDGTCDGNDRNLALNCFGNTWGGDACEVSPPNAINVDGGGQFGSCVLDGVCDGNDANAALACFGGGGGCPCTGGPTPEYDEPEIAVVGQTGVTLRASAGRARPGDLITVDVYFDNAIKDIKSYQLHVVSTGGERGQLELVDIAVEKRRDLALDVEWQAFNVSKAQLVVGMDPPGVSTTAGAYLATYTYRVSRDAAGTFMIDLLHDNTDPAQRTFLFPTPNLSKIAVTGTSPALLTVEPAKQRRVSVRQLQ